MLRQEKTKSHIETRKKQTKQKNIPRQERTKAHTETSFSIWRELKAVVAFALKLTFSAKIVGTVAVSAANNATTTGTPSINATTAFPVHAANVLTPAVILSA